MVAMMGPQQVLVIQGVTVVQSSEADGKMRDKCATSFQCSMWPQQEQGMWQRISQACGVDGGTPDDTTVTHACLVSIWDWLGTQGRALVR